MYPENVQELIEATQKLLEQTYPILQEENCSLATLDAWIRVSKALEVLELQEQMLPKLPTETIENGT